MRLYIKRRQRSGISSNKPLRRPRVLQKKASKTLRTTLTLNFMKILSIENLMQYSVQLMNELAWDKPNQQFYAKETCHLRWDSWLVTGKPSPSEESEIQDIPV